MCTVLVGYQCLPFSEHPFVICSSSLLFTPIIIPLCLWFPLAQSTGYCLIHPKCETHIFRLALLYTMHLARDGGFIHNYSGIKHHLYWASHLDFFYVHSGRILLSAIWVTPVLYLRGLKQC